MDLTRFLRHGDHANVVQECHQTLFRAEWTLCNAGCCPNENNNNIIASTCFPPSPCEMVWTDNGNVNPFDINCCDKVLPPLDFWRDISLSKRMALRIDEIPEIRAWLHNNSKCPLSSLKSFPTTPHLGRPQMMRKPELVQIEIHQVASHPNGGLSQGPSTAGARGRPHRQARAVRESGRREQDPQGLRDTVRKLTNGAEPNSAPWDLRSALSTLDKVRLKLARKDDSTARPATACHTTLGWLGPPSSAVGW